ncbi:MAG: glycine--tRNA ligase subunit beta [Sphingomonadaceae bacterium]
MTDFLLELLSEEIPARMQAKARADLERLFAEEIAKSGLKAEAIETHATPRRLILIARGLPAETAAVSEELKGPRASAPPQALEGFLRKTGLTAEQLVDRDGVLFAVIDKPGRATAGVLAEAIPAIIRAFPWPKSMRWGTASQSTASLRWVRPLQGIVALLGDDVVDCEIDGIRSGAATVGHRFHHPGIITIGSAHDYVEKLRACHVIVSHEERQQIIRDGAAKAAAAAGLSVIPDEGLVQENAGLTEYPVPLLGHFDPAFLEVPREVIQLTMRTNQKYFALTDSAGKLAPNFICTANIEPTDGGTAIAAGNAKVLAARLSDAKFFWEQDLKVPLEEQAKKLDQIVFHEKLGTVADKVDRVAKLARWLVEERVVARPLPPAGEGRGEGPSAQREASPPEEERRPSPNPLPQMGEGHTREHLADLAEQAARLCKADLVTGMVGEFPELQGVMGGYYARAQGLDPQVADAIRDHYKPVGQGDDVPTAPVTVAVSLADKLDSLISFFAYRMTPSGSKDPFALRRSALGVISLLVENEGRLPVARAFEVVSPLLPVPRGSARAVGMKNYFQLGNVDVQFIELLDFFADRLKVQQREAGVRHDLIDAVFALGGEDDLVRLLARVKALQAFVSSDDGANLLTGYKRAANILKKEGWGADQSSAVIPAEAGISLPSSGDQGNEMPASAGMTTLGLSYTPENEEAALIAALDAAEARAGAAVDAEDFEGAMAALAGLRAPIDAFFDKVTVNDPDPAKRAARLALLARIRDAVHTVADFSRIEG